MNILIINASPRKDGNISRILAAMQSEAEGLTDIQVKSLRTNALRISPCRGCMSCRSKGVCALPPDDAQNILSLIQACDVLIIGAPCYWGNMPGTLKLLFDRIVYGLVGESNGLLPHPLHRGKRAILISTSTTPFPWNILFRQTSGTVRALRSILRLSGFKITATIQIGGTHRHPISEKTFQRCRRTIRHLCIPKQCSH